MKRFFVACLVAITALPLVAQNNAAQPEGSNAAESSTGAGQVSNLTPSSGDAASSQTTGTGETPVPHESSEAQSPTTEEINGKVDSLSEAFTELKNVVDALSKLKVSGYLQAQFVDDERSVDSLPTSSTTQNRDQFSVRRARLKFTWQAAPTAKFVFQPDISSSGATLKDGYLELTEPWTSWKHTLTAGQFPWPFGFEIGYSSSDREMPERSLVVRTLFPGERDRGVMLSGAGFSERFTYRVAVVNGTGTSQSFDFNEHKDIVGRLGFTVGPVDVGVSAYDGEDLVATTGAPRGLAFDKTRQGIDFQWITPIPGMAIRGEYIRGEERGLDVEGDYLYIIQNIGTRHQLVARFDEYDPNIDSSSAIAARSIRTWGGSYIFHWDAHSKVMTSYEAVETSGSTDPDDDVLTVRYQFKF